VVAEVWNDLREEHGDNITAAKIKVAVKEKVNAAYDDVREQILEANRQGAAIPVPPPLPVAHVAHNSGENEWYTPPAFIEAARRTMGSIDTDPASSGLANKIVGAKEYFTIEDDGLTKTWAGNVWMNPPFAQPLVTQFCTSLVEKIESGEITQACVLVNNFTETAIFQRMALACACFCFPHSRIKFLDVDGNPSGAPLQGQVILYFGPNVREFTASFGGMGVILYAIRST
jgi:ParB family chromosome partitioning protein